MKRLKNLLRGYYGGASFLALLLTGSVPAHWFRKFVYRRFGMTIGQSSWIYMGAEIRSAKKITIGENCSIGHDVILDGRNGLVIGNNVNISSQVWIWTMQHDPQSPTFASVGAEVLVEDYVWISGRAIILPGVVLAKGTVVAAGAVVTRSTEAFSIVAGMPARKIGERERNLSYRLGDAGPTPFI
jgi:acetyltransferase-like isoleucine patch superfamily enzyme